MCFGCDDVDEKPCDIKLLDASIMLVVDADATSDIEDDLRLVAAADLHSDAHHDDVMPAFPILVRLQGDKPSLVHTPYAVESFCLCEDDDVSCPSIAEDFAAPPGPRTRCAIDRLLDAISCTISCTNAVRPAC